MCNYQSSSVLELTKYIRCTRRCLPSSHIDVDVSTFPFCCEPGHGPRRHGVTVVLPGVKCSSLIFGVLHVSTVGLLELLLAQRLLPTGALSYPLPTTIERWLARQWWGLRVLC